MEFTAEPASPIREVRVTPLLMPLRQPYVWAQGVAEHFIVNLVEIEDDEGRCGIGECTTAPAAAALAAILRQLGTQLVGRSPFDANVLCRQLGLGFELDRDAVRAAAERFEQR